MYGLASRDAELPIKESNVPLVRKATKKTQAEPKRKETCGTELQKKKSEEKAESRMNKIEIISI